MNTEDFRRTAPSAVRLGPAVLQGYRLGFTRYSTSRRGGVADIMVDLQRSVEGIVWLVPDVEMHQVDAREGAFDGIYQRMRVNLTFLGEAIPAYTYEVIDKSLHEFQPSPHYANLLMTGALELSHPYQRWLTAHISELYEGTSI
jgi:cation transport regulator ChaC